MILYLNPSDTQINIYSYKENYYIALIKYQNKTHSEEMHLVNLTCKETTKIVIFRFSLQTTIKQNEII